jgi:hypothetical protein
LAKSHLLVKHNDRKRKSQIRVQQKQSTFIRTHNEMPSVVAVCVSNPDCPPLTINGRNAAPTPSGFAEIVSDYFPILHPVPGNRTHDYADGLELRIRVRERQATLDLWG